MYGNFNKAYVKMDVCLSWVLCVVR